MSRTRHLATRLALVLAGFAAALFAGCADMPMNKPSALSPAHHGTAEAP
jgi:hypothetical protein